MFKNEIIKSKSNCRKVLSLDNKIIKELRTNRNEHTKRMKILQDNMDNLQREISFISI